MFSARLTSNIRRPERTMNSASSRLLPRSSATAWLSRSNLRPVMRSTRARAEATTPFEEGLRRTVDWYLSHRQEAEARDV